MGDRILFTDDDGRTARPVMPSDPLPVEAVVVEFGDLILPPGIATEETLAAVLAQLETLNSLVPAVYDYIELGYTGDDLTSVIFRTGGAAGSIVSTLTLVYAGGNLVSVEKT
jgi:hypothetical protein